MRVAPLDGVILAKKGYLSMDRPAAGQTPQRVNDRVM